jgi:hypothetical protein
LRRRTSWLVDLLIVYHTRVSTRRHVEEEGRSVNLLDVFRVRGESRASLR